MDSPLEKLLDDTVVREKAAGNSLVVMNGPEDGRVFPVEKEKEAILIGRLETSDVVLMLDMAVSRSHARLSQEAGSVFVEDLNSRYGTSVDGSSIQGRRELRNGSVIQVGETLLRFCQDSGKK